MAAKVPKQASAAGNVSDGGNASQVTEGPTAELIVDAAIAQEIARVRKLTTCPSKSAVVKLVANATTPTDDELIEEEVPRDILSPEELKSYRSLQEPAVGKRAEQATAYLRAHEAATAARDALKPIEDLQLIGLQLAQVQPRIDAKLVELQRQKADNAARWQEKEREDAQAADALEEKLLDWIKAYKDQLEKAQAHRKTERAKWAAAHEDQMNRLDAKIGEVTKLLEKAKKDLAALVVEPTLPQGTASKSDVDMSVGKVTVGPQHSRATAAVASQVQVRPLAVLPQIIIQDEAQLARLAKAQAVIDQAAQQDAHVDLAMMDIGLSAGEIELLVGANEWEIQCPEGTQQPANDWPLPKRVVALIGKAVSRIQVTTAVAQTAQAAAAIALAEAIAVAKSWQVVEGTKRPKCC